ncbi:dexx-box atpase [Thermosipho africanus Ob7]|nr:dexx-box atpase [Thermosipho africanus Ob7]
MLIRSSYVDCGREKEKCILFSKAGVKNELFCINVLLLIIPENMIK